MRAVRIHRPGTVDLIELPEGPPRDGYARVRVEVAGLSLQEIARLSVKHSSATMPRIAGTYGVGTVLESGDAEPRRAASSSRRVLLPAVRECGRCSSCRSGDFTACEQPAFAGVDADGYLAEVVAVPTAMLVLVPAEIPARTAVFAAPLARCISVLHSQQLEPGDFLLVFGATVEGLLLSQLARLRGMHPILIDPSTALLELASRLGIAHILNPYACHAPDEVAWTVGDRGVFLGVLAAGAQGALDSAPFLLSPGATVVVLHAEHGATASVSDLLAQRQSIVVPPSETGGVAEALQLLRCGRIEVERLVSLDLPMESAVDALALLQRNPGGYLQVIVRP